MSEAGLQDRSRRFAGASEMFGLPPDLDTKTLAPPSIEVFRLPEAPARAVISLADSIGTCAEIVVLAALRAALHRDAGQDDADVLCLAGISGEPLTRRVIVRTHPSDCISFRSYVAQIRDNISAALAAGAVATPDDLEALRARQGAGRDGSPVLISVSLPGAPSPRGSDGPCLEVPGLEMPGLEMPAARVYAGLHLTADDQGDGLLGRILYDDELFEAASIRRMAGHLVTLLERIAVDPDCLLGRLPLLTLNESRQITIEWNNTPRAVPDLPLHRWFELQVSRTPDAPALHFNGATVSYHDLDRRADQLAGSLAAAGASSGTLVAVCLERSPDLVAGLLAVLKTGAAYLPLDPAFPRGRLAIIAEDAQPLVVLTQRSLLAILPRTGARIVCCDDEASPEPFSRHGALSDCLRTPAYVLYTSGSTGRPKGVEVPHGAVVNLLASMQAEPGFGADDALLAVTTIAFDIATLELFLPLVSGGRVILASREVAGDPLQLLDLMRGSECTVMQATPATWRGLIAAGWQGDARLRILCGGESMSPDLAQKLLARCGALWNMYGPTETTVWSTIQRVVAADQGCVPIGRPIGNTTTYIMDARGGLVPVGVAGELLIGGSGVATGYWRNPSLTDQRFLASPYRPGERLYRTGDIARYRADGVIEWLGRADGQVKIRGFRIETQEIEAALERHADVAGAAVRTWPDDCGQPSLAAYVVPAANGTLDGATLDVTSLRRFLRQTLPDYMIPTRYVVLAALPLTPNGKVDRNALPEPAIPARPKAVLSADDRERRLAAIWERLLKVTNLSEHDEFFELGGDSILAVSLLLSIEAEFGRRLTMAALFEAPTIARMAALLGEPQDAAALPLAAGIQPNGSRPSLFWIDGGPMFLPLANALGTERPFLGVTLHPPELREVGFQPDLQTIARHLVKTITTIQAAGPYVIGGYCAGGVLAYEVASQLMASGQNVALVCMIDAQNPTHFKRVDSFAAEFAKFRHHFAGAWRASKTGRLNYVALHLTSAYRRILSRSAWRPVMKSEPFTLGEIMQPAVAAYRPAAYAGRVALFQARRPKPLDLRPGWAETVTGNLMVHDFPGTHQTMLEQPQVQNLARLMNTCLDMIEESQGHPKGSNLLPE